MDSLWKSHVVLSGSIEHALLTSASLDTPRTRRRLLVIAVQNGLTRFDEQTVATALKRLKGSGLLEVRQGDNSLRHYQLTPHGQQVLQILTPIPR